MKIRPVGVELFHAHGQMGRHDEANSRFLQFHEETKNDSCLTKNKPVTLIKSSRLVTNKEKIGIICQTAQDTKHTGVKRQNFKYYVVVNFMVAPCISNNKPFIVQLMHTNYKILRLLKQLKL